jgi:hypothetical protein
MPAIRIAFFAVAALFLTLAIHQGLHAYAAFERSDAAGGWVAVAAAVGCLIAGAGTIRVTLKLG